MSGGFRSHDALHASLVGLANAMPTAIILRDALRIRARPGADLEHNTLNPKDLRGEAFL